MLTVLNGSGRGLWIYWIPQNQNESIMSDIDVNSTPQGRPVGDFPQTLNALSTLQHILQCRKCCQPCKELYTLGQCEHRFCRLCAHDQKGKVCPVCEMPSHATHTHVDKQLSNIASLCMQMADLLEGRSSNVEDDQDVLSMCKSPKETPKRGRKNYQNVVSTCESPKETPKRGKKIDQSPSNVRSGGITAPKKNKDHGLSNENSEKENDENHSQQAKSTCKKDKSDVTPPIVNKRRKGSMNCEESLATFSSGFDSKKKQGREEVRKGRKSEITPKSGSVTKMSGQKTPLRTPKSGKAQANEVKPGSGKLADSGRKKINLSKRNAKGETPLQVATIKGDAETVKQLLELDANPNVRDNAGWTPLHEAVNHGAVAIAELLISHGASVNAPGLDNDTPLHDAVSNYRIECIKLLVSKGANTLARNIHGRTPLDLAQTDEVREILLSSSQSSSTVAQPSVMVKEDDIAQPLCFLGTALSQDQQRALQKCADLHHAKVVEEYSPEVTHLITGVNAEGNCPRTLKYLSTLLAGRWILSSEWVQTCLESNTKVSEEGFEIGGCSDGADSGAPYRARQNRLQQLPGLFDGCQFYFHGKFSYPTPSREELASLVKQGGGVILTREPRLYNLDDYPYTIPFHAPPTSSLADCAIFVIYDDNCPNPPHVNAQRMSCLPVSWLLDSTATFALLDKSLYLKQ